MLSIDGFLGFKRQDRGVGIRNYTVIVCISPCAEGWSNRLKLQSDETTLPSRGSCTFDAQYIDDIGKILLNPNVGAVLCLSMGCDSIGYSTVESSLNIHNIPNRAIELSSFTSVDDFVKKTQIILKQLCIEKKVERQLCPWSSLFIGAKCGGSDYSNGLFSNPLVNDIFSTLLPRGASCLVSEVAEYIGMEDIIADQFINPKDGIFFKEYVQNCLSSLMLYGEAKTQMVKGNVDGGLTTIEEKALSSASKFIKLPVTGYLETNPIYRSPKENESGLFIQLGTHQEPGVFTEMAAVGCVGALFTTGVGGGFTHPIIPLFVISASDKTKITQSYLTDFKITPWKNTEEKNITLMNFSKNFSKWVSGTESSVETERLFSFAWPRQQ